jgi:hypothetical protein
MIFIFPVTATSSITPETVSDIWLIEHYLDLLQRWMVNTSNRVVAKFQEFLLRYYTPIIFVQVCHVDILLQVVLTIYTQLHKRTEAPSLCIKGQGGGGASHLPSLNMCLRSLANPTKNSSAFINRYILSSIVNSVWTTAEIPLVREFLDGTSLQYIFPQDRERAKSNRNHTCLLRA